MSNTTRSTLQSFFMSWLTSLDLPEYYIRLSPINLATVLQISPSADIKYINLSLGDRCLKLLHRISIWVIIILRSHSYLVHFIRKWCSSSTVWTEQCGQYLWSTDVGGRLYHLCSIAIRRALILKRDIAVLCLILLIYRYVSFSKFDLNTLHVLILGSLCMHLFHSLMHRVFDWLGAWYLLIHVQLFH